MSGSMLLSALVVRARRSTPRFTLSASLLAVFILFFTVGGPAQHTLSTIPLFKTTSRLLQASYKPQPGVANPPLETFLLGPSREKPPKVHLFIPLTKHYHEKNAQGCRVLQGAIVNGYTPIIYNWDKHDGEDGGKLSLLKTTGFSRLLSSERHTKYIADDDLILVIDAVDIWLQLSPEVVARRYVEYGVDVLGAAEKNCFPQGPDEPDCVNAPKSPLDPQLFHNTDRADYNRIPRHANAGTVIGRFDKMKPFFNELAQVIEAPDSPWADDQGIFNRWLTQGKINLDYYTRVFWPGHSDQDNIEFIGTRYPADPSMYPQIESELDHDIPWNSYPSLAHHRVTGQIPVVMHFNGHSKDYLEHWWGKLWWQSHRFEDIIRQRLDKGIVRFALEDGYKDETFGSLCGRYMDELIAPQ